MDTQENLRYCFVCSEIFRIRRKTGHEHWFSNRRDVKIAKQENLNIERLNRKVKCQGQKARACFNQMLKEIGENKYSAILTWAPDRLSRNAGDLGDIVDLMDAGKLQKIRTHGQTFINTPKWEILAHDPLCSQAKILRTTTEENENVG